MRLLKKSPIHPSFILLFLWFVVMGNLQAFFIFVGVVLAHELGHYYMAKRLGYKLDSFFLAPYGVSLNYKEKTFDNLDELKIAFAGPCINFLLALIVMALWWIFPASYNFTDVFVKQSFMLGLFNLLPAYPLDGGRIFLATLNEHMPREKAVKIIEIGNIVFSCIFLGTFILSCATDFNPTLALFAIFLISGILQTRFEGKYKLSIIYKKKIKNFSKPINFVIKENTSLGSVIKHIQQNKFTLFYIVFENGKTIVIDENIILKWSMLYPFNTLVGEIFKINKAKAFQYKID